jgi:UDP-glucose 4-epimerase
MKILITGGCGMIGLAVCKNLCARGEDVKVLDLGEQVFKVRKYIDPGASVKIGSILDQASLREAMRGRDIVIHLAAQLGVRRTEENKLKCLETNIDGTENVLNCAIQENIKKIVFASSSEVYGEPVENPVSEKSMTQGKTVYAVSKLAGEELCKAYSQRYSIKHVILRYFNCYGPFQTAQFVLPKFVLNVKNGLPPEIYGDGRQIRSYTYVSDVAEATSLSALSEKADNDVFNVGDFSSPISLYDLADLVIKTGGMEGKLKPLVQGDFSHADRAVSREIFFRYCDGAKARDILGWRSKVGLKDGVRLMFETGTIFKDWEPILD